MIHCDKKSHQPEIQSTIQYSDILHECLPASCQSSFSIGHRPSSIIHPRINISLSSNLIDGLGASVSFFIPAKAIVAQSPGFLDTRVGDNIYRAWNGGDLDGDALLHICICISWGTESGEVSGANARRLFWYTEYLLSSCLDNFRIGGWVSLYSADTACSTFIWGLTLMSTNNQPEQVVYQPIQGLNSTPQGVMPRIHGSKKHRVYLKLSLFRISMTVVHQSFQHATYAKGYNKELFSLVANPGVIDCHTLAVHRAGLLRIGK